MSNGSGINMDISAHLAKELIRVHEGTRLYPYEDDKGNITIGVGRNLTGNGITTIEVEAILAHDIHRCFREISGVVVGFGSLHPIRRAVLIDMFFQLGQTRFSKFKNMLACIAQMDCEGAAREMLDSVWGREYRTRAQTLADLFLTCSYEDAINVIDSLPRLLDERA
jgi:lysozyme